MQIAGSSAVVTGGASGIGRAIVEVLAARGARVLVADVDGHGASAVAERLGGAVSAQQCDVADHASVVALATHADNVLGGVDLIFANAGVSVACPLLDAPPEALDWILRVNVVGTWNTAAVFGRRLRDTGRRGHICLTGSEHALGMQHAGMGFYTATKMAVLGMGDVLRTELPQIIGVSVLCPGLVDTELYLSKRTGPLPQDPAPLLAFAGAVMAHGMPASEIGRAAVDGVERGDFLIVTHAASFPAAERRSGEIEAAFAIQAPPSPDSKRYKVDAIIAAVSRRSPQSAESLTALLDD